MTVDEFVKRSREQHGSKYNYSQVRFHSVSEKVTIGCFEHGPFEQAAIRHYRGAGCSKCANEASGARRRVSTEEIKASLTAQHPNLTFKFDAYTGQKQMIEVICPTHGEYKTTIASPLSGHGCRKCQAVGRSKLQVLPFDEFVARARERHAGRYTYKQDSYKGANGILQIVCAVHGEFEQRGSDHTAGSGCPKCSTNKNSKPQLEIVEFVRSLGLEVVENYKYDPGNHKKEIDIYIPEMKFGIEYHGIYFHSSKFRDRAFHLGKLKDAQAQGIRLAQVFSDEWETRPEVIKRYVLHSLGYGLLTTYARKCEVAPVTLTDANDFYDEHHIQGRCGHGLSFGLTYKSEVVAVMTFSKKVSRRGASTTEDTWELARFASSMRVTGGASRLTKHLMAETGAKTVVSYSDNRLFLGGVYEQMGFVRDSVSAPNYSYVNKASTQRLHKAKFQHKHLAKLLGAKYDPTKSERENCAAAGYHQIFDCGLTKWVLTSP